MGLWTGVLDAWASVTLDRATIFGSVGRDEAPELALKGVTLCLQDSWHCVAHLHSLGPPSTLTPFVRQLISFVYRGNQKLQF